MLVFVNRRSEHGISLFFFLSLNQTYITRVVYYYFDVLDFLVVDMIKKVYSLDFFILIKVYILYIKKGSYIQKGLSLLLF